MDNRSYNFVEFVTMYRKDRESVLTFSGGTRIPKSAETKVAFNFYAGVHRRGHRYTAQVVVPTGTHTDGATVPFSWMHKFITRWGDHAPACIVHDVLCRNPELIGLKYNDASGDVIHHHLRLTEYEVDKIFKEALKVTTPSAFKRWCMYMLVRGYRMLT